MVSRQIMVSKVKNDVVVPMGGKTRIHLLCDDDGDDDDDDEGVEREVVLLRLFKEGEEDLELEVGEEVVAEVFIEPLLKSLCVALAVVAAVFVVVGDVNDDEDVKIILFIKRYHIFKGFVNVTNNIKLK